MKNLLYIFILFFSSIHSQTPGYLGKRVSIESDINLLPNTTNFILDNSSRQSYNYDFNNNYEIEETLNKNYIRYTFKSSIAFNYTLSRKTDISLRFNKMYGNFMYSDNDYQSHKIGFYFDDNLKYQSTEFDINFKFYNKNFIAPVGKYFLFGFGFSKVKSKATRGTLVTNILINSYYTETSIIEDLNLDHSVNYLKLNFGFGNKTVLANDIFLTYGIESNFYLLYNNGIKKSEETYITQFKNNYNSNLSKNLLWDNIFCLKFGVGIML
jgi:hypothetical protein